MCSIVYGIIPTQIDQFRIEIDTHADSTLDDNL